MRDVTAILLITDARGLSDSEMQELARCRGFSASGKWPNDSSYRPAFSVSRFLPVQGCAPLERRRQGEWKPDDQFNGGDGRRPN